MTVPCPDKYGWQNFLRTNKGRTAYALYLRSARWQEIRKGALIRANHQCSLCPAKSPLNVHHITYKHIGKEWPEDLRVLCEPCHSKQHREGFTPIPKPEVVRAEAKGHHQCQARARRGGTCCTIAQRRDSVSGLWLCHIHHPAMTFQQQVAKKRERKRERKMRNPRVKKHKPARALDPKWLGTPAIKL